VGARTAHNIAQHTTTTQHIPAITPTHNSTTVACVTGTINNEATQMLLDSSASCSVISKKNVNVPNVSPGRDIQLVNADGRSFTPLRTAVMTVTLGKLSADHHFLVVDQISIPVILGCDFMCQNNLVLDIKGRTIHQSANPMYKLHLDAQRTEKCNPMGVGKGGHRGQGPPGF